jgi:hypothetical protein
MSPKAGAAEVSGAHTAPTMLIMNCPERFFCTPVGTVIPPAPAQSVLATRKPTLLLRLSGWFLLR